MAIRKIARMGHPILRQVAEPVPVEEITGPEIQALIADLLETVEDANGAGLREQARGGAAHRR
jgi:peptide deformylase